MTEQGLQELGIEFGNYGDRGGGLPEEAFEAWFKIVKERYKNHTNNFDISYHPKFIKQKLKELNAEQFGYNLFF